MYICKVIFHKVDVPRPLRGRATLWFRKRPLSLCILRGRLQEVQPYTCTCFARQESVNRIRTTFCLQWTMKAAGNRTCIITLRLSDFTSQTIKRSFLGQHESTNEKFSYLLVNKSNSKTFIDQKPVKADKLPKKST